ncbi:MAG: serine protease [Actinomycetota bacterium]
MRRTGGVWPVGRVGLSLGAVVGSVGLVGCGGDDPVSVAPAARVAVVSTEPCGDASGRTASGVLVVSGRVVTAAHVVVDAERVSVRVGDGDLLDARVTALDTVADIAVLEVGADDLMRVDADASTSGTADADIDAVAFASFESGETVRMVGGAASATTELVVRTRAAIEIEEVRGTERVRRDGYELLGETADGDSGAGVYDTDGRLGAIVFAASNERSGVTFAVAAREVDRVLDLAATSFECDPVASRLVPLDAAPVRDEDAAE